MDIAFTGWEGTVWWNLRRKGRHVDEIAQETSKVAAMMTKMSTWREVISASVDFLVSRNYFKQHDRVTELFRTINLIQCILNTLKPRQNGRHFPDDIFKCILLNGNVWIATKNSLKFVSKGPINNIPALVQIMAWRRPGDKRLSEPMMFTNAYMRHPVSMS